ncbi:isocitrate/isopropylmalate family dehydrogenase [Amycolatopsis rubida]|uniref:Isocitrate/isopropylmalate dehydrogenase n=2 Tax=Amycolatopsis rubida TaxID=112413 RepID=A0A1I5ZF21_9PSEU|nr:isocitrate/isopropylmalate family dehydrogenase [Amycolatopsis rubida]SFQ55035.1 Isocitrate/isopropylmalate dehydrogenase [Amycolatopsis rubida]
MGTHRARPAVGLAVGRGTGPELADVFTTALTTIGRLFSTEIDIRRSPRTYHSYFSLKAQGGTEEIRRLTHADADHYEQFCRVQARAGVTAVFRTAMNAQSLYLVRQRLRAVKVDPVTPSLLMVRDEAQGFYTGENRHGPATVTRTTVFSREITGKVVEFALRRAREQWPGTGPDRIVLAYKFHLLDGAFGAWVAEIAQRLGVQVELCQPDTVNRNLIEHGLTGRTLLVAGNEWGDVMHVVLLDRFGGARQEDRCSENVHLHPEVAGLVEYQTVHGSADDLAGTGRVNPTATLRASAAVAQRHAGCPGAVAALDRALRAVRDRGVGTPDTGGAHSTEEVVAAVLAELRPADDRAPVGGS